MGSFLAEGVDVLARPYIRVILRAYLGYKAPLWKEDFELLSLCLCLCLSLSLSLRAIAYLRDLRDLLRLFR